MTLNEIITKTQKFVTKDIWHTETENFSRTKRRSYGILKILIIAVKGFIENGCSVRASALTFFTLLSIVPILALAFALAKGFGLESMVENVIKDSFQDQPVLIDRLMFFSSSLLEKTKGGLIAGVGVIMLLYSVFKLLSYTEDAFNFMWNVKKGRPILRKVTDYMTIMVFTPILLIMSSSVTIFLTSHLNGLFSDYFSPVATILLKIVAWVLMMLVFTIFYLIMPNTKVELKAAFVSGLITGVIFEIWQWIFVTFLLGAVNYGAVYGSFAALPLFLVWLQTSWIIVLVGCELAYSIQNVNRYATEYYSENISMRLQKRLALLIMTKITESFRNEEKPKDSSAWSQELQISQKLFMYMTGRLQESGLLVEIKDESSMNPVFIPGVETGKITTAEIFSRLESLGKDKDFPIKISGDFQKIEEICTEMEKKIYETVL